MSSEGTVAPAPQGYTINLVDPQYVGNHLVIAAVITAGLSGFFLSLRLYTRRFLVRGLGWDDWWIVCAWVFAIALSLGDGLETQYGMGYHLWDIKIDKFNTYLKLQLFVGAAYICALAFAKVSICCFYLCLSPEKSFRILVFLLIGFTAAYSIAGFIVLVFSCNPISASWDLALIDLPTTTCINRPAEYLAQSSINIVTDICIFFLPMPIIWRLQLPFRQKLSVSLIFAIGLVVCIISMIRLKSIVNVLYSADSSWTTNELLIWSTIEVHTTIICGCLATLKPFVSRFFPTFLGKSSSAAIASFPTVPRKNTKLAASRHLQGEVFALQSRKEHDVVDQEMPRAGSNAVHNPRRWDGDGESQESIIGVLEHDIYSAGGVGGT